MKFEKRFLNGVLCRIEVKCQSGQAQIANVEWEGATTAAILPEYTQWMLREVMPTFAKSVQQKVMYAFLKSGGLEMWCFDANGNAEKVK